MGYLSYKPDSCKWSAGSVIDACSLSSSWNGSSRPVALDQNTLVNVYYKNQISGGYGENLFFRAYQFRGNSVAWTTIDSIVVPADLDGITTDYKWIWQPGENFLVLSRPTNSSPSSYLDSLHLYTFAPEADGSMPFHRRPNAPTVIGIDQKVVINGMGDTARTSYSFNSGVFDQFLTPEFGAATDSLPGKNGETVTSYYTLTDSSANGINYKYLAGEAYQVVEANAAGSTVQLTSNTWSIDTLDTTNGVYFRKLLQTTVSTDGVPKVTAYAYDNPAHHQVTQITETNSDGTIRITKMKYPLDYSWTGASTDSTTYALDSLQHRKHVVNAVIEKQIVQTVNGSVAVIAADLTKWKEFGHSQILPWQSLKLRATDPVSDTSMSSVVAGTFLSNARYTPNVICNTYTGYGQIVQQTDANGVPSSIKWGYKSALPIAAIANSPSASSAVAVFDDSDVSSWSASSGTWVVNAGVYQQTDPNTLDPWSTSPNLYSGVTLGDAVVEGDVAV